MFINSILASKTFIVIVVLIVVDVLMRMPLLGLSPSDVEQVHNLIFGGMITFGGKEAVTNFATKGQASGTFIANRGVNTAAKEAKAPEAE